MSAAFRGAMRGWLEDLRWVETAASPFCGGKPHFIVQQPLTGPRDDRVPDGHDRLPLPGQVQAQFVARVYMRKPVGIGSQLQDRITDLDCWPPTMLVADLNGVVAGELSGLQFNGADELASGKTAVRGRDGLPDPEGLLRQAELAAGQRGSP